MNIVARLATVALTAVLTGAALLVPSSADASSAAAKAKAPETRCSDWHTAEIGLITRACVRATNQRIGGVKISGWIDAKNTSDVRMEKLPTGVTVKVDGDAHFTMVNLADLDPGQTVRVVTSSMLADSDTGTARAFGSVPGTNGSGHSKVRVAYSF